MKKIQWIAVSAAFAASAVLASAPSSAAPAAAMPPALKIKAASLIALLSDSHAGASAPVVAGYLSSDASGDKNTAIVSFTLEGMGGGNQYFQYLAAFEKEDEPASGKNPYRFVGFNAIGGKGWRSALIPTARVIGNQISFDTLEYKPDDPFCCPTIKSRVSYKLDGQGLSEAPLKAGAKK